MREWLRLKVAGWRYRFAVWKLRRRVDRINREMGEALLPALNDLKRALDAMPPSD
jgi:hypothetical protein